MRPELQCTLEHSVERIEQRLDSIQITQVEMQKSIAQIEAVAARDRWWQQAGMWFMGIMVAIGAAIAGAMRSGPHVK